MEPPYKSRGEAQVGRLLDRYGIPFSYEQGLIVLDRGRHRTWHPDFTLPTFGDLIVEYVGMPDVPDYARGLQYKKEVYRANHVPVVYILPDDLKGSRWPERVLSMLRTEAPDSGYVQPGQYFH